MFPEKLICFVAYFWTLFQSSPQRLLYNFTTGALATLFVSVQLPETSPDQVRVGVALSLSLSAGGHQEELEVVAPCNGPIVGVMSVAQLFAEAAKKRSPARADAFIWGTQITRMLSHSIGRAGMGTHGSTPPIHHPAAAIGHALSPPAVYCCAKNGTATETEIES